MNFENGAKSRSAETPRNFFWVLGLAEALGIGMFRRYTWEHRDVHNRR